MDYGLNRTERIEVRVSPDEYKILDRMATKHELSLSDYLRWMALWGAVKSGDKGALKMTWERLEDDVRERRQRFYEALGLPGIRKLKVT